MGVTNERAIRGLPHNDEKRVAVVSKQTPGIVRPKRVGSTRVLIALAILALSCIMAASGMTIFVLGAPSDPNVTGKATFDELSLFMAIGALLLLVGSFLGIVGIVRRQKVWEARQVFVPPPGWPASPPNWRPWPGWMPNPEWPDPPVGWQFWRAVSGSDQ